jgi:hypothetical protein
MRQLSEQDLILLNGYLDGRLSDRDRAGVEARLARDAGLRAELEALRQTVGLLTMAERVPVPRNFTLDAASVGRPARRSVWDGLGLASLPGWAFAGASLVVALLCVGAVLLRGGLLGSAATSVAMQPAVEGQRAAAPLPLAAATEAPAETEGVLSAKSATLAGGPAAFAPVAPSLPPPPSISGSAESGVASAPLVPGGASGGSSGGPLATASPYPQPTPSAALVAPAPPEGAANGGAAKAIPTEAHAAADQANAAATASPAAPQATATNAPNETPARIAVTEAQPFEGLTQTGWIVLGCGTLGLIALVVLITVLMRRRNR